MFCRTCGSPVNDNAEVCVKCGCKPLVGKEYCQNCGQRTKPEQEVCVKCGVPLKSTKTIEQNKDAIKDKALKVLPMVLLVIGILLCIPFIGNLIAALMSHGYEVPRRIGTAIRCGIFAAIFIVASRIIKKKFS